jgi:hypothetical protein
MEDLYQRMHRKEAAAAKFEEERRREASEKEAANRSRQLEKQRLLAQQKEQDERRSRELSERIARCLQAAAQRRHRCLELIRERTGASGCDLSLSEKGHFELASARCHSLMHAVSQTAAGAGEGAGQAAE